MADITVRNCSLTVAGRALWQFPPSFTYRSARILEDVSVRIKKGQLVAILGTHTFWSRFDAALSRRPRASAMQLCLLLCIAVRRFFCVVWFHTHSHTHIVLCVSSCFQVEAVRARRVCSMSWQGECTEAQSEQALVSGHTTRSHSILIPILR